MDWYSEFNGTFFISLATLIVGVVGVLVKTCLQSKCTHTNLCFGCIAIERDVHAEEDIELASFQNATPRNSIV